MAKDNGIRFSVYFHKEQVEYMDREAEKMGISRSKFIEIKCMPKELQILKDKKGNPKGVKNANI